jgi:ankyrin repeat protein
MDGAGEQDGEAPVRAAIRKSHKKVVEVLRKAEGWTAAHVAADGCDADALLALALAGADLTAEDKHGCTPVGIALLKGVLHHAAEIGHKEVVEVLLAHGANVDTPDKVRTLPVLATTRPAGRVELVCHTVSGAHVAVTAGT